MSVANRVIKNTGFLYAKMGITMFISLYTTRLILNALGVDDFGIFNVVGGAIGMMGFLQAAMSSATQRFMSYYEGKGNIELLKHIFNVSTVLHFGIALVLIIVLIIAGFFFFNGILNIHADRMYAAKIIYASFILSTVFTVISVPYEAVLNAHENMLYYSIVGVIESLLKLTAALIIIRFAGDKLILYGILMAAIPFISRTVMQVYCHRKYTECVIAPRRYWEKGLMKEMTSFAGWSFMGTASSMIGNYGNGVMLNHFFGAIVNAALGVVTQLNGQLMAFSNNMIKALNPVIVKKEGSGNRQSMLHFSLIGSKISFSLLAFFSVPVLVEAPFILKIWLTDVPLWTVIFLRLHLIRALLEQLTITLGTSLSAQGDIKGLYKTTMLSDLLPLPILYILFKMHFPPYWMYIIMIIFMVFIGTGFKLYYCKKLCSLSIRSLIKVVIYPSVVLFGGTLFMSLTPHLFMNEGLFRFLIAGFLSVITFVIIFYLFLTKEEKQIVQSIRSRIWK